MFGIQSSRKRERLLLMATIDDLRKENQRVRDERDHERRRSEALMQMLLAKTQGMVIKPEEMRATEEIEAKQKKALDLYDEGGMEGAVLDALQKGIVLGE